MKLDVVGVQEAAQIFGVESNRVSRWKGEGKMPPAVELAATPVWHRRDIMRMARRYKARKRPWWNPQWETTPLPCEIVGLSEVTAMLGLGEDKKAIGRWRNAGVFPEPLLEKRDPVAQEWRAGRGLSRTPVWNKADVEAFGQQRAAEAA